MASSDSASSLEERKRRDGTITNGGRRYLSDPSCSRPYPLPIDLVETHRQIMFTHLTSVIFEAPFLSKDILENPPLRVLDLGCDTGFWSFTCHQYFHSQGHRISFVGLDIKPPPEVHDSYQKLGMDWHYIQHDLNQVPWPIPDGSFDVIMAKNIALALNGREYGKTLGEYARVLKVGGTVEIWEHDSIVRNLRPRILDTQIDPDLSNLGVYPAGDSSLLCTALNPYVTDYNSWVTAGLATRELPAVPCSFIDAMSSGHLVEGADAFDVAFVKRVAIPLDSMNWELLQDHTPRPLSKEQKAIRQTALDIFIGMVEALDPLLRAASGKSQGAWETWVTMARKNWLQDGGFCFGEFLEFGAWSLKKVEA